MIIFAPDDMSVTLVMIQNTKFARASAPTIATLTTLTSVSLRTENARQKSVHAVISVSVSRMTIMGSLSDPSNCSMSLMEKHTTSMFAVSAKNVAPGSTRARTRYLHITTA